MAGGCQIAEVERKMKKAKNARAARYLKSKEPKVVEDEKHALFLRSAKTSEISLAALRDITS